MGLESDAVTTVLTVSSFNPAALYQVRVQNGAGDDIATGNFSGGGLNSLSFTFADTNVVYCPKTLVQNYALSVQGFSILIFKYSRSDTLQFNWNDFQSFVKQPMDFQSIVVESIFVNSIDSDGEFAALTATGVTSYDLKVNAVPLPAAAVWLFGSALMGLVGVSRRKSTALAA